MHSILFISTYVWLNGRMRILCDLPKGESLRFGSTTDEYTRLYVLVCLCVRAWRVRSSSLAYLIMKMNAFQLTEDRLFQVGFILTCITSRTLYFSMTYFQTTRSTLNAKLACLLSLSLKKFLTHAVTRNINTGGSKARSTRCASSA